MRIRLVKFRQYDEAEFNFQEGQFNFLSGKNSIGKSTIFEAILWCLYGKVQHVTHQERPNDSTMVVLEFSGLKIDRQRDPVVFRVTNLENGFELWNTSAQEFINKKFGSQNAFIATSYIRQGDKHILFQTTPGKRMKLLAQIAFLGDNPEEISEKISSEIKLKEEAFRYAQNQYQNALASFNSLIQTNQVDAKFILTTDKITEMKTEIEQAKIRLVELQQKRDLTMKHEAERECLEKLIYEAETELTNLPDISEDMLVEYEKQLVVLQDIPAVEKMLISRRETLLKLERTDLPSLPPPNFSETEMKECTDQFRASFEMRTKTISLGIGYDPDIIDNEKESLRTSIECQWMFPIIDKYEKIKAEHDALDVSVWKEVTPEFITEIDNCLRLLEQTRDILECPQCHSSLRHIGSKLELSQGNPFNQEYYDKIRTDHQNAKTHLELLRKLQRLKKEIEETTLPDLPKNAKRTKDVNGLRSKLHQIESIRFIEQPSIKPVTMQSCIEWNMINGQIQELTEKLAQLRQDLNKFDNRISAEEILKYKRAMSQRKNLQDNLINFRSKLAAVPASDMTAANLNSIIIDTNQLIQNLEISVQKCSISHQAMTQHQIMSKIQNDASVVQNDIAELNRMKTIVTETETFILQDIVNRINRFMKAGANRLSFEKPLSLEISLFQKIQKTKIDKKVVNFKLRRGHSEFSDFEKMGPCGGEKTCFYMLVAIALNRLTGSPLLILDESFYSLDRANKDELIVLLKESLQGCTVIITCHESHLGHDDIVVKL